MLNFKHEGKTVLLAVLLLISFVLTGCGDDSEHCDGTFVNGRCILSCDEDLKCPADLVCQANGECIESCLTNDCTSGEICNENTGLCTASCETNENCPSTIPECDLDQGLCVYCFDLGAEPNETMDASIALTINSDGESQTGDQRLCGTDNDWFSFETTVTTNLTIGINITDGDISNIGMDIVTISSDNEVVNLYQGAYPSTGLPVALSDVSPGVYYLRIYHLNTLLDVSIATTAYNLTVNQGVGCINDSFESNPGPAYASSIAEGNYDDLVICGEEEDWYGIELTEGRSVRIDLDFLQNNGNLDLALISSDQTTYLSSSEGNSDGESINFPITQTGVYYIRVWQRTGGLGVVTYNLNIEISDESCIADSNENNGGMRLATAVTFDQNQNYEQQGLTICSGDEDWFAIPVNSGQILAIETNFANSQGDLQIQLVDGNGETIAGGYGHSDNEFIRYTIYNTTTYYLRVYGSTQYTVNAYNLFITLNGSICTLDRLETNDNFMDAHSITPGTDYNDLTICIGESDWYALDVADGQVINAYANFDPQQYDLGMVLYYYRESDDSIVWLTSSDTLTSSEFLSYRAFTSGRYFLYVYRSRGTLNAVYNLRVDVIGSECSGDNLEPNDTFIDAYPITSGADFQDLTLCVGEVDWYSIELNNGEILSVNALFDHLENDLGMYIYRLNNDNSISYMTGSDTLTDNESIVYVPYTDGTYLIYIYRSRGTAVAQYSLNVTVTGNECDPDQFEPNDTFVQAATLTLAQRYNNLTSCVGDTDWYTVDARAGQVIDASIYFTHAQNDFALYLYKLNSDGTYSYMSGSDTVSDNESVIYRAADNGTYLILVSRSRGTQMGTYSIEVNVTGDTCQNDQVEPNDTYDQATPIIINQRYNNLTSCVGDVDWYSFEAFNGQQINANIYFSQAETDFALYLYKLNSDQTITYITSVDSVTDNESIIYNPYENGTYLLYIVRSRYAQVGNYSLEVDITGDSCENDQFESNDSYIQPAPIDVNQRYNDLTSCSGDADWYSFDAENGQLIEATIYFTHTQNDFGLYLYKLNSDGTITGLTSSDTLTDNESVVYRPYESATYILYVYRSRGTRIGTYSLEVDISGDSCIPDQFEPDDSYLEPAAVTVNQRYDNLTSCSGDVDWYSFDVQNGQLIEATIYFTHTQNDFGITLYKLNSDGTVTGLTSSDTLTDNESVVYRPYESATYILYVYRSRGTAVGTYSMEINITGDSCTPDQFEPNDSYIQPADITDGTYNNLTLCTGDSDWYSFDMENGELLDSRIDFSSSYDLAMYLYRVNDDGSTTYQTGSDAVGRNYEIIQFRAVLSGTYLLLISGVRGTSVATYSLSFDVSGLACTADSLEYNEHWLEAAPITANQQYSLSHCANDIEYYSIALGTSDVITVNVDATASGGGLDVYLYRLNADNTLTHLATAATLNPSENIVYTATMNATYIIYVTKESGIAVVPSYTLSTQVVDN